MRSTSTVPSSAGGLDRGARLVRGARSLMRTLPSMTRSRTRASSISWPRTSWTTRALADDEDPVGETEHLLDLAGHDDDGDAGVGQRRGRARRSRLRAPTSTPRVGSSSSSTRQLAQQPPGEHDLLLVAARQRADRAGRRRRGGRRGTAVSSAARRALRAAVEEADPGEPAQRRDRDVAVDRLVEQQPLALALLGAQPDAGRDRGGHRAAAQLLAVDGDGAGGGPAGAVDGLEDLGAAGADQPGEADDLAGVHGEVDAGERRRRARGR